MVCGQHFQKLYSDGGAQVTSVAFFIFLLAGHVFSIKSEFFQQILDNTPMFALISLNDDESKATSVELLQLASVTILKPRISISTTSCGPLRPHVNKNLISFIVIANEDVDDILDTVKIAFKGLHEARVIFVLLSEISSELLQKIVSWCWFHRMINVLILLEKLSNQRLDYEIFSFNPFPSLTIQKIPNNSPFKVLFPEKVSDLKGFPIRTVQKYDHPRSFKYVNSKGQEKIGGYLWKAMTTWISHHNGKLEILYSNTSDVFNRMEVLEYVRKGQVDMVPHFISLADSVNITSSSSIFLGKSCVIVPQSSQISPGMYLFLPFHLDVWYVIIFATFYISLVESICVFIAHGQFDPMDSFCNVILGISYQVSNQKNFKYRPYLVVHGQLMILGFILTNLYLALLSSFLTTTVYDAQIDTYEDIDRFGLKLMIEADAIDFWMNTKISLKWKHVFYGTDREAYMENLRILNSNFGYFLTIDKFMVIDFYQKPLKRPLFHLTSIDPGGGWSGLTVRDDLVFLDSFNQFITRSFDIGLREKWLKDILPESIEAGIIKPSWTYGDTFTPLTLPYLQVIWVCLFCGYGAGLLSFSIECTIRLVKNK
ncbi:unnamed protein product [Hermetia illucens]|uniref:Ionotropic receptor n=1 Tax=Hermetia illucens TaxID=343691 RepID=A0A7R8UA49_HERIL|nr:uncharacterized protein LOC119646728 [Hermetia illucens]CAD7076994.1 unnamed protein product [Hermetia illucens]